MKSWNRRNFLKVFTVLPFLARLGSARTSTPLLVPCQTKMEISTLNSLDLQLLLYCIAEVETGNDDTKIGPGGERSRYQISEVVWRQHQDLTHRDSEWMKWYWQQCCKGDDAERVAMRHLLWLNSHLPHTTSLETDLRDYCLAWCWRGGLHAWKTNHPSNRININNYAVRVSNLYQDYLRHGLPK